MSASFRFTVTGTPNPGTWRVRDDQAGRGECIRPLVANKRCRCFVERWARRHARAMGYKRPPEPGDGCIETWFAAHWNGRRIKDGVVLDHVEPAR